jgi:UDP-N-acetylglucosamine 2-epimerase (non-hydrolysing)
VGNIMLDSFEMVRPMIEAAGVAAELGLEKGSFGVLTLHRPSNVDDPAQLLCLVESLVRVQQRLPLVFPVHPRTAQRLHASCLAGRLEAAGVKLIEPAPYIRFMSLVTDAVAVITDSGGVQEETTYLGIPCLTLRENTERPITIDEGTNRLVSGQTLETELAKSLKRDRAQVARPDLWDGKAAARCLADLRTRSGLGRSLSIDALPLAGVAN